jgi:hypothetical protein
MANVACTFLHVNPFCTYQYIWFLHAFWVSNIVRCWASTASLESQFKFISSLFGFLEVLLHKLCPEWEVEGWRCPNPDSYNFVPSEIWMQRSYDLEEISQTTCGLFLDKSHRYSNLTKQKRTDLSFQR